MTCKFCAGDNTMSALFGRSKIIFNLFCLEFGGPALGAPWTIHPAHSIVVLLQRHRGTTVSSPFQHCYSYILVIIHVISKNCNPLAHFAWKCHHTNLWTTKLFHLTEGFLRFFKRWRLWREPVVGCHRWLWREPVVMCGNWNVRQAMSQQMFRVTTFCINTCFQSFSTMFSGIVHHAVPKFSPCRNKQLPQASICSYQYMRSSCSVSQTQDHGYADNRKHQTIVSQSINQSIIV